MIGPARLSCRSGVARAGASRSGALLSAQDEHEDKQMVDGVDVGGDWHLASTDTSLRTAASTTAGEGPHSAWTLE